MTQDTSTENLILYYLPTCPFCNKVMKYLDKNEIHVGKRNISEDQKFRQELQDIGGKTQVPCLVANGEALYESDDIIDWFKKNIVSS